MIELDGWDFGMALMHLKCGHSVRRRAWKNITWRLSLNQFGMGMQSDNGISKGQWTWKAMPDDLLANDWELYNS